MIISCPKDFAIIMNKQNMKYKILDTQPEEGDYGINPRDPKRKPRLVERYSDNNTTLGMRIESPSWFGWLPLRSHHRKVILID